MPQRLVGTGDDVIIGGCGQRGGFAVLPGTSGKKRARAVVLVVFLSGVLAQPASLGLFLLDEA